MTLGDLATLTRFLVNQDSNTYADSDLLIHFNQTQNDVTWRILRSQDEWNFDDSNKTDLPILKADTVASQKYYTLPTGTLKVERLDVSYDGTTYYKAEPFDQGERGIDLEDISDFQKTKPYYDLLAEDTFQLLPTPDSNVTDGLVIRIARTATEFTSDDLSTGTKEPGFDPLFHKILAYGAATIYAESKSLIKKVKILAEERDRLYAAIEQHYGDRQQDRHMSVQAAYVDYGEHNGYGY